MGLTDFRHTRAPNRHGMRVLRLVSLSLSLYIYICVSVAILAQGAISALGGVSINLVTLVEVQLHIFALSIS